MICGIALMRSSEEWFVVEGHRVVDVARKRGRKYSAMKVGGQIFPHALGLVLLCVGLCQAAGTQKLEPPRLVVQRGHADLITALAFSPDGKILASGGTDTTVKLWETASGQELRTLSGHLNQVDAVAFSPDGKTLASGSADDTVKLWDVANGQELRTLSGHSSFVHAVAFSPDGRTLVSGSRDGTVKLWDIASGRELRTLTGHSSAVEAVAFSPNGKTLASGSKDDTVKLWDIASGNELRTLHSGWVNAVTFSPDGRTLASGSWDGTVMLWDIASGQELRTVSRHSSPVISVIFSHDGKKLASGSWDDTAKVWEVASGQELSTLTGHSTSADRVAFSPDGKTFAAGSHGGTAKLWDIASGQELLTLTGHSDGVLSVAFSPDQRILSSGGEDGTIKLWNTASGQELRTLSEHFQTVETVAFSPDGHTLALGSHDATIRLWDVASGRELRKLSSNSGWVETVAFCSDDKTLASASRYGTVKLWDVASGQALHTLTLPFSTGYTFAFSPDCKALASAFSNLSMLPASPDKTIKLWDVAGGNELHTLSGHSGEVGAVAFSPDGKTLASTSSDGIKLWDVASGNELLTLSEHSGEAGTIAFSPDGRTLAWGIDSTVGLWGISGGEALRRLSGHSSPVDTVAFSPDGKMLGSGGEDGTIKLWRVTDGALLATLTSFSDGRWTVTDPEGRFDTADLEDMPYLHWMMTDDPFTSLPLEIFMRDYYEPRLLSRIMNGETFKSVRVLGALNRVQPQIRITDVQRVPGRSELVDVSVEASGAKRRYRLSLPEVKTAAHDLRLFRDGQLVGYSDGTLSEAGKKPYRKAFRVRLPAGNGALRFTAYAFNDDRVKSKTATIEFTPPVTVHGDKPRAYVIAVGVNHHENTAWDLKYAANDARAISESVAKRLRAQERYQDVVSIKLVSNEYENLATKAKFKAILDHLAGHPGDVSGIPNADQLHRATPDDLVLVSFSGHGVDADGEFYLIPSDTGLGLDRIVTPALLAHAISSNELADWWRDVDGGDMAMIIDACQSAASVGSEFKPGPMGARGLGQLAYEKGMRILAASQAEQSAQESNLTQLGLLTYALVRDGLDRGLADFKPRDTKITLEEWLSYGVQRVPGLAIDVERGNLKNAEGDGTTKGTTHLTLDYVRNPTLQQPALFDFTKGRRDATVATHVE
jgi:WD40 repeat protein/uncharacterized caspase-like protein